MQKSLDMNLFEQYRKEHILKNADGIVYAIINVMITLVSFVSFLYMSYVVFENKFGVVGTLIMALITFIVPGIVYDYIKKNKRDTMKRHIVLSIVKFICTFIYAYVYYIVLKSYIPTNILIYTLVGTSITSYIFYIVKFETMTIFIESIKSTFIELCLSCALFTLVDIKTFLFITAMVYLPSYISSAVKSALKVSEN